MILIISLSLELVKMKVSECAKLLNKSPQFVRIGLQRGILPFGYAIKMSSKWTYHISEAKVYEYLGKKVEDGVI